MEIKFRKEKLSRKAIDDLAKRNVSTTAKAPFPYTTASGERILVSPSQFVLGDAGLELKYLLGQTYPFHYLKEHLEGSFTVTDLAFDKDRKPWGKPDDVTALLMLSTQSRILNMRKGPNGQPVILNDDSIQPVIHNEGRSMDD